MLIAIESVELRYNGSGTGYRLYGKVGPVAVVVRDANGIYALGVGDAAIELDQLIRDVPALGALIASSNSA